MAREEEERAVEQQLETQLQEQKDSLSDLNDAVSSDPSNLELLSVKEELVQAIKDAEEGLFQLKRSRLLREADSFFQNTNPNNNGKSTSHGNSNAGAGDGEIRYSVGSKCRFRYGDGRWYNGKIVEISSSSSGSGSDVAKILFLTPTSENMLTCKFFLEQRCRFGSNCRLSHGVDMPLNSLKNYIPTAWDQSLVGSNVWAVSNNNNGIWREAELESWDSDLRLGSIVFRDDGSSEKPDAESLALSEYALMSDEEEESETCSTNSDYSENGDDEEEEEESGVKGLGFLESTNLQRGIQTETAIFAKWENHTRGIASKMMASMGYREGMGLGASGQGIVNPISVKALPAKQSLDHALESQKEEDRENNNHMKKRSRGGKRKREKKFAALSKEQEEESRPDVFSLINTQLSVHHNALNGGSGSEKKINKGSEGETKVDRRALVAYEDQIRELRARVEKLEEMVNRNRNEKVVYEAAMRKLSETRKALAEAEATRASASNSIFSKEKEKKWLKF